MLLVGLTGGIGAGKSTVSGMLAAHGAVVVDADRIARDVVEPGTPAFRRIVERFGPDVVRPDGTLDRARLASRVFEDDAARDELNAIVHPEVMRVIASRVEELKDGGSVVVLDVPLLLEIGGGEGLDCVVVVEADEDARIDRVVNDRGMSARDVRARIAAQASSQQRRALADVVLSNDGTPEELRTQVDALWERLVTDAGRTA
ncbi:MAG: dephospho-CoA kinase [Actinomycetota bacterium]